MPIEINNGKLRVRLVPEIGGSIIGCAINRDGQWVSVMREGEYPLSKSSNASSFVLIPYSNRLRDGRFLFEGKSYQLRDGDKHAIHGDVRDRPLSVREQAKDHVTLHFDSRNFANLNFPFPFVAHVSYVLEDNSLISRIEVINVGSHNMPAGCGFHPYFNRRLPGSTREVELQLAVKTVYPGKTPLPTGSAVPIEAYQDFSRPRPLDFELDHCFAGWSRQAVIEWPGTRITVRFEAEAPMEHVIVFSPPDKEFFAIEPVTNANDGFNLYAKGDANCGVVVLQPGESLSAGFRMQIDVGRDSVI